MVASPVCLRVKILYVVFYQESSIQQFRHVRKLFLFRLGGELPRQICCESHNNELRNLYKNLSIADSKAQKEKQSHLTLPFRNQLIMCFVTSGTFSIFT